MSTLQGDIGFRVMYLKFMMALQVSASVLEVFKAGASS